MPKKPSDGEKEPGSNDNSRNRALKIIIDGIVKIAKAVQEDPWIGAKATGIIAVTLISGGIFSTGEAQETPFIVLAGVYLMFMVMFVVMLRLASKSEIKR